MLLVAVTERRDTPTPETISVAHLLDLFLGHTSMAWACVYLRVCVFETVS